MSFVNLMGNDIWSEADIKSRLHAEVRSEVSELAEAELNRALQGHTMGMHVLTPQEQQGLMRFKAATDRVALLGTQARADMALLAEVLPLEVAFLRLRRPVLEPLLETEEVLVDGETVTQPKPDGRVLNQEDLDRDLEERGLAAGQWALASEAAAALVQLRNPEPPVIDEPTNPLTEGLPQ